MDIKISHQIPDGRIVTFTVEPRDRDESDDLSVMVFYDAALDLSGWPMDDAYPVDEIEAAASAHFGEALKFSFCDGYGADTSTWEVWHLTGADGMAAR